MTVEIPQNNASQPERVFSSREYGETLASLRASRGLSQAELARRINITPTAACYWEKGRSKKPLSESRLSTIQQVLDLTEEEMESLREPLFRPVPGPDRQTAIFSMYLDNGYRVTTPLVVPRTFTFHDVRSILDGMQELVDKYLEYKKQAEQTRLNN